jgi:predicted dehydrogenase
VIKIKIGVIGAGRWGQKHIAEYSKIKDAELAWVSDLSKEAILNCKQKYNISNISTDYKDILESDVKAVSICTSNETHYEVCKAALNAGKHVLVEKPLTVDPEKAYELVDLAAEKKLILAVGHLFRYNNAINEVKKLIDKKYFGKINYLRLQWTIQWSLELYPDKKLDIIVDMMPHLYDIMNYLTGLWPEKVTCFAKNFIKPEFEDTAYIYCEFPNNIMTHSEISWTLPEKVRQVDVIGSKATAKIKAVEQKVSLFEKSNDAKELLIKENNTLGDELKAFIEAVKQNKKLRNDGLTGAKTVELIKATKKSLESGKTVSL